MAQLGERAYRHIRAQILQGELEAGTWLREEELSTAIGMSRTPVREALRRLHVDGLVNVVPNRGAQVVEWPERDLDELFDLRGLLEGFGASLAATRITEEQLSVLESLADEMEAAATEGASADVLAPVHHAFHLAVAAAAANKRLQAVIDNVSQLGWMRHTLERYGSHDTGRSMDQHREIILALRSGHPAWAQAIMQAHVLGARRAFPPAVDEPLQIT
jgi:DNA-binding GntR family transcriptional regulator